MKPKIKNTLILVLMLLIGFGVGIIVTFHIVFRKLEAHGLKLLM